MHTYALYVESGPRRKKTQVHVIELLGCMANGPTTEDALIAAPDAIREYLRFLESHGEKADPKASFETKVAEHVTEGTWIGQGDPDAGFPPDFEPLTLGDQRTCIERLGWMQDDFIRLFAGLTPKQLDAKPAVGRSLRAIAGHVPGAHHAYMQTPVQRPRESAAALRRVEESPDMATAMRDFFALADTRLEAITPEERKAQVQHGIKTWTARRMFRRMMEHQWEHLQEARVRLGVAQPAVS